MMANKSFRAIMLTALACICAAFSPLAWSMQSENKNSFLDRFPDQFKKLRKLSQEKVFRRDRLQRKGPAEIQTALTPFLSGPLRDIVSGYAINPDWYTKAIMTYMRFHHGLLRPTVERWHHCKSTEITRFKNVKLRESCSLDALFFNTYVYDDPMDFSHVDFSNLDRSELPLPTAIVGACILFRTKFTNANMPNHRWKRIELAHKTDFTHAKLNNNTFGTSNYRSDLSKVIFNKAVLDDCRFKNTKLSWKQILQAASIARIRLDRASLQYLLDDAHGKNKPFRLGSWAAWVKQLRAESTKK